MKKLVFLAIVVITMSLQALGYTEEARSILNKVVFVSEEFTSDTGKKSLNTMGTIVDKEQGYIVTCGHGLNPKMKRRRFLMTYQGFIRDTKDDELDFDIVYHNKDRDVALLKVKNPSGLSDAREAVLGLEAYIGEEVVTVGSNTKVAYFYLQWGYLSGVGVTGKMINKETGKEELLMGYTLDMNIMHGTSGSGLFNKRGELIGIILQTVGNVAGKATMLPSVHVLYGLSKFLKEPVK